MSDYCLKEKKGRKALYAAEKKVPLSVLRFCLPSSASANDQDSFWENAEGQ